KEKQRSQRARPALGGAHPGTNQTANRKLRTHASAQSATAPSAHPPQRQAGAQVPGTKRGSMLRCCGPAAGERRQCAPWPGAATAAPRHRLRPGRAPDELPLLGKSSRKSTPYIDSASESRDTAYKKHIVSYGKSDLETVSGRNKRDEQTTCMKNEMSSKTNDMNKRDEQTTCMKNEMSSKTNDMNKRDEQTTCMKNEMSSKTNDMNKRDEQTR